MAVPLSPSDIERKRQSILRHQSQKDRVAVPGEDPREFWQRAAERNRASAEAFDQLGLPHYAALETFAEM
jgi:glucosamine-6-phosphate deaminase